MPRLDAIDIGIQPQQSIAIRLRDVVVPKLLLGIEAVVLGILTDEGCSQVPKILRRRVVLRRWQTARVGEPARGHPQLLGRAIHCLGLVTEMAAPGNRVVCNMAANEFFDGVPRTRSRQSVDLADESPTYGSGSVARCCLVGKPTDR